MVDAVWSILALRYVRVMVGLVVAGV